MKIIQTSSFLKKQAQFNNLPGDIGLPPGTTNQMIDRQFGGNDVSNFTKQSGELETKVDWAALTSELINVGHDVMGLPQQGLGDIIIFYGYDAETLGSEIKINNLRMLDIKVLMGGRYQALTVSEPSTKEGIFEGFQDEIVQQEKMVIAEQSKGQHNGTDTKEEQY